MPEAKYCTCADSFAVNTWTSMIVRTDVPTSHAPNFKASPIPEVFFGMSEKCMANTVDPRDR